jgi:hypothetical protein
MHLSFTCGPLRRHARAILSFSSTDTDIALWNTFSPENFDTADQNGGLQTCATGRDSDVYDGAGLCLVLSPFPLDASFTSARVNISDHIGNTAKLVLRKCGGHFCAGKEARDKIDEMRCQLRRVIPQRQSRVM